jgi:hypothetical protein
MQAQAQGYVSILPVFVVLALASQYRSESASNPGFPQAKRASVRPSRSGDRGNFRVRRGYDYIRRSRNWG